MKVSRLYKYGKVDRDSEKFILPGIILLVSPPLKYKMYLMKFTETDGIVIIKIAKFRCFIFYCYQTDANKFVKRKITKIQISTKLSS